VKLSTPVLLYRSETANVSGFLGIIGEGSLSLYEEKYHQRNKVETVFSILKRKVGESLKARKYRLQVKEIKIKVILYNLSRIIAALSILILIGDFYRAEFRVSLNLILKFYKILIGSETHSLKVLLSLLHEYYNYPLCLYSMVLYQMYHELLKLQFYCHFLLLK